jgi:hypothetical protein
VLICTNVRLRAGGWVSYSIAKIPGKYSRGVLLSANNSTFIIHQIALNVKPFTDEAQTALFKEPVRTAQ